MDQPVAPQEPMPRRSENQGSQAAKYISMEVVMVVLLISLIFGVLNFFNVIPLYRLYPGIFGWLPHLQSTQDTGNIVGSGPVIVTPEKLDLVKQLEACVIGKEGNPLVTKITLLDPKTRIIDIEGNITKIDYNAKDKSAVIDMNDVAGTQKITLTVKDRERLVYNATKLQDMTLSEIKLYDTVMLTYICDPNDPSQFMLGKINKFDRP